MKQKTKAIDCLNCIHVKKKRIYGSFALILIIALLAVVVIAANFKNERERRLFTFDAEGLADDGENTIDIRGTGSVGMSGWIIFSPSGEMNLTLWAKGSGTITLVADGKEHTSKWKPIENCGYVDWWVCMKINLTELIGSLPRELTVTLTESSKPKLGDITVSTGPLEYANGELIPTGVVYQGTGLVVIN